MSSKDESRSLFLGEGVAISSRSIASDFVNFLHAVVVIFWETSRGDRVCQEEEESEATQRQQRSQSFQMS